MNNLEEAIKQINSKLNLPADLPKGRFHRTKNSSSPTYYTRNEEGLNEGNNKGQFSTKKAPKEISDLWGHHHEIARMSLLGYSKESIAEQLGLSSETVRKITMMPAVKEKISILQAKRDDEVITVAQKIKELAQVAVNNIEAILECKTSDEDPDPRLMALKLKAATDILDRNNHTPIRQTVTVNKHEITDSQRRSVLDDIRGRAISIGVLNVNNTLIESSAQEDEVLEATYDNFS